MYAHTPHPIALALALHTATLAANATYQRYVDAALGDNPVAYDLGEADDITGQAETWAQRAYDIACEAANLSESDDREENGMPRGSIMAQYGSQWDDIER